MDKLTQIAQQYKNMMLRTIHETYNHAGEWDTCTTCELSFEQAIADIRTARYGGAKR